MIHEIKFFLQKDEYELHHALKGVNFRNALDAFNDKLRPYFLGKVDFVGGKQKLLDFVAKEWYDSLEENDVNLFRELP